MRCVTPAGGSMQSVLDVKHVFRYLLDSLSSIIGDKCILLLPTVLYGDSVERGTKGREGPADAIHK